MSAPDDKLAEGAPVSILAVDDEVENLELYARALRGYPLRTAQRGDEAMAMLAEQCSEIVISDQRMPGTTGTHLLERARAINPISRRVLVTAYAELQQILEAINRGSVERYLLKPIAPERLRSEIDQLAEDYRAVYAERARVAALDDKWARIRSAQQFSKSPGGWQHLELELERARRYQRPLSLVLATGISGRIAELTTVLRRVDQVVPLGEALVIALVETDRPGAELTRERLRTAFPGTEFRLAVYPDNGDQLGALLSSAR
jgi:response regulator RpfG family c-di-GMP phosphodiesterase